MTKVPKFKPPPIQPTAPAVLSPAREALADHLAAIAEAHAEAARLLLPVHRLRATVEAAENQIRITQVEADAISKRAAADLEAWAAAGDGARPVLSVTDSAKADTKIENAKRALETASLPMAAATQPLETAQLRVSQLSAPTAGLVLAVIQEEADAALERLRHARKTAADAEAVARGLIEFLGEQGRTLHSRGAQADVTGPLFRLAEKITTNLRGLPPAEPKAWSWAALMGRLGSNATTLSEVARYTRAATQRARATNTVDAVLDSFLERYVRKQSLRSGDEIERAFRVYVRPRLGDRSIYDLRRRDIVELLDAIEDENGPVMADRVLAYLRKAFSWQATRDDNFSPPIVRGMAKTKPKERTRSRILNDQEIRDLWTSLDALNDEAPMCYAPFVRTLLFTGQRRENVASMRWEEITGETWLIPPTKFKTKVEHAVPLSGSVRTLLGANRKAGFVFSSDGGKRPFSGFSKAKKALDRKITKLRKQDGRPAMPHWVHHDLRRTTRSLLSRAGVPNDIAERVLGHVIPGVRGVYDRHSYEAEKRDALELLVALVDRILNPISNVVSLVASA